MRRPLARVTLGLAAVLVALVGTGFVALVGDAGAEAQPQPSAVAEAEVPRDYLVLTREAAVTCPGLSWTVLAAIARVESDFGTNTTVSPAGAEGPMQFLPSTFALYDHPVPADQVPDPPNGPSPSSIFDPTDAVFAAARMLCADGAGDPGRLDTAIWDYNHSGAYVAEVETYARVYAAGGGGTGATVAAYGRSQVGVPYVWGGESPGSDFDCSGLAQWAWAQVGVALPRTAQEQFDAGPRAGPSALAAGDLVFFGSSAGRVSHVGIYLGDGLMVDAPHEDAAVRVEPVAGFVPPLVGASDPGDAG